MAASTDEGSCGKCAWWLPDKAKKGVGSCRGTYPIADHKWPETYDWEYCHEFTPAIAKPA